MYTERIWAETQLLLGVFIYFTKVFDYLDHDILPQKLEYYGIRGTPLELYVNIAEVSSETTPITPGVAQGILGPFLFSIYVNDIISITPVSKFMIYADYTSIFVFQVRMRMS